MKKHSLLTTLGVLGISYLCSANEPDSVYLYSYGNPANQGRSGLQYAWSLDQKDWNSIGNERTFLSCDYGRWGSEKRMHSPYMINVDNLWHIVWSLNDYDNAFAYTTSEDLLKWKPQKYIQVASENCTNPVISYNPNTKIFTVAYQSKEKYFETSTKDFKQFSKAKEITEDNYSNLSTSEIVNEKLVSGQIQRVAWNDINNLIRDCQVRAYNDAKYNERMAQDGERFAGLQPLTATIKANPDNTKDISSMLIGAFFEDINYAADGGLYAELVQNRDFEYALSDKEGHDQNWNSKYAWSVDGDGLEFLIDTVAPIHVNNKNYAVLKSQEIGGTLNNSGFDGIVIKKGEKYDFSVFAKMLDGKKGKLNIRLVEGSQIIGETTININSTDWKKHNTVITAKENGDNARLVVQPEISGDYALDMISLFPQNTFKGRKNGLRNDLAQTIADMKPRFVRFPGGCVSHGDGINNIYKWQNTVGPLESRVPMRNLWGYHQTTGLGYYEYFLYCEDMGAEPVPVVAAGVPCQNSARGGCCSLGGQQGGIPMEEMGAYIQEVLDLIEWANGDKNTKWGKVRAEAGHPKPFNLKYIGVGNEDLISEVFEERFTMINNAIKEKYPEIQVIGTAGPFYEGSDYEAGWELATKLNIPLIDEHYYVSPGWLIYNQDYYDRYDRNKSKVYLGEYASHLPGRPTNLETALSEAIYLTAVERNGDIVEMTSYAPLLAKERHTQWNPDLIYFNNAEVKPTVGYYVQKLYGQNSGDKYVASKNKISDNRENVQKRFGSSIVKDSKTGDVIVKIANLLPVQINTDIDLSGIDNLGTKATKSVLAGNPADRDIKPAVETIDVDTKFDITLEPYSFTVLRIAAPGKKK